MSDILKSKEIELEKHFQEFDPYLSNVVMDCLNKKIDEQVLLDKSNLIGFLSHQCRKSHEFVHRLETALLNVFDPYKVNDPIVMKRIIDINLLYRLKWSFDLRIEKKVNGRALELVVESVLKSKLCCSTRFDYEFVDWKAIDYMILDRSINDWIVGIQCKTALNTTKGYLNYKIELGKLKDFAKNFSSGKTLVMFCGNTVGYRNKPYELQKEEIKNAFEREGWKFYSFWVNPESYKIDDSFYEFMDMIERIVRNEEVTTC